MLLVSSNLPVDRNENFQNSVGVFGKEEEYGFGSKNKSKSNKGGYFSKDVFNTKNVVLFWLKNQIKI